MEKNVQPTGVSLRVVSVCFELWSAVVEMIQHGSVDVVAYARKAADPRGESSALADRMAELSALDRLLLRAIVAHAVARRDGQAPAPAPLELFSAAARARVKAAIGMTPTPTQIQGSLLRLADGETSLVTAQGSGVYEIDDPYTLAWLQEELLDEAPATRSEGLALPASTAGEDEITDDSDSGRERSTA